GCSWRRSRGEARGLRPLRWAEDEVGVGRGGEAVRVTVGRGLLVISPGDHGASARRKYLRGYFWLDSWQYSDHPMDLADASLVAASEALRSTTVFTLDRGDFTAYRARMGRTS